MTAPQTLLVSFPNQIDAVQRIHSLAAFDITRDLDGQKPIWVRAGATHRDLGITGMTVIGDRLYCLVQSKRVPRLAVIDLDTWRIAGLHRLKRIADPHSMVELGGSLYVASSGTNAVSSGWTWTDPA